MSLLLYIIISIFAYLVNTFFFLSYYLLTFSLSEQPKQKFRWEESLFYFLVFWNKDIYGGRKAGEGGKSQSNLYTLFFPQEHTTI